MVKHSPPPTRYPAVTVQAKPATGRPGIPPPPTRYGTAAAQPKPAIVSRSSAIPPPTRYSSGGSDTVQPMCALVPSRRAIQRMEERPSTPIPDGADMERLGALGYSWPSEESNTFHGYVEGRDVPKHSLNCWQALLFFLIEKGYLKREMAAAVASGVSYEESERFLHSIIDFTTAENVKVSSVAVSAGKIIGFFDNDGEGLFHVGLSLGGRTMWSHARGHESTVETIEDYLKGMGSDSRVKADDVYAYRIKPEAKA